MPNATPVYVQEGWPNSHKIPGVLKSYWQVKSEINMINGLLLKGERIVIPAAMRLEMLDRIHEGHQGITKCRERAKKSVWWPGLSLQIEELVKGCRRCAEQRVDRKEPIIPSPVPSRP